MDKINGAIYLAPFNLNNSKKFSIMIMVIIMAKRKKSKESNNQKMSVELTGLLLILIGIIGFGFGYVGMIIKEFAMFLLGSWWLVFVIYLIIVGMYMLFKRKLVILTN